MVLFIGENGSNYTPEIKVVSLHELSPVSSSKSIKVSDEDKSLLYDKEVIKNLFTILSYDSDQEPYNTLVIK